MKRTRHALACCAAAVAAGVVCNAARGADLVFGDFENGLDPNLEVVQFNGGPNSFNGSTPNNVTHGAMSGNFTTATAWQQYLRFNNSSIDAGTVAGELANYNALAIDITVPAGTSPEGFFVHEMVINASGFGFLQSGNVTPAQGPPDDLKGRERVTLLWNYRTLPAFDTAYAAFLATPATERYFQALLVSNWGNGWDGPSFDLDNWRLTNPVVPNAAWNADASGNWSQGGNWNPTTPPNNAGAVATFGPIITAPRTVTVDAPHTVGSIIFNSGSSYTIAGPGPLTLAIDTGPVAIRVDAGSHTISAPLVLNRDLTATVTPGDAVLTLGGQITSTGRTIAKGGSGRLDASRLNASGLNVNAGTVRLLPNGTAAGTSRVNALSVAGGAAPTAKLDVTNNAFVVDYTGASPLDTVKAQITTAYNGGAWDGNGITSGNANASNFGVGYGEASALTAVPAIFGSVDSTSVLIRHTRYGDANLDGQVNLQDFNRLASNFGAAGAAWTQGDFNYDGNVNLQDFNRLASNFGLSAAGPEVTPDDWARLGAAVPEPGAASVLVAMAMTTLRRRRSTGT
jgi:hypothetical protein